MGIKATVKPHVVAGTCNGGEDLYLSFLAHEDDTVQGVLLELEDGEVDWYWENEEGDDSDDENEGTVYSCTTHYEFVWKGTRQDLLKLLEEQGGTDTNTWSWYGPVSEPPKKRFKLQLYVDGNAD